MAIDKLEHFATILGNFSLGVVIGGFIVFYFTKPYLISYLTKKAENLATKEDIASITDQVELVKSQYSVILENIKAKNQLRLAALDKRLQVHQEAFTLWRELFGAIHSPDIGKAVIICQEWWGKNCIYLEPEVRRAFTDAYTAANMHASILQDRTGSTQAKANWKIITNFPNTLFAAIQLPALTEMEAKSLGVDKE